MRLEVEEQADLLEDDEDKEVAALIMTAVLESIQRSDFLGHS